MKNIGLLLMLILMPMNAFAESLTCSVHKYTHGRPKLAGSHTIDLTAYPFGDVSVTEDIDSRGR